MHGCVTAIAKVFTIMTLTVGLLPAQTQREVPSAQVLIDPAIQAAMAENKAVLIHFGASWCSWCKRLDAMLESDELKNLIDAHYVLVNLTVQESEDKKMLENPGAQEIMDQNGAGKAGVPYYLFLDKNGKKLADSLVMPKGGNIGYPVTKEEIQAFEGLLQRTAPRMSTAERSMVVDYLVQHRPSE